MTESTFDLRKILENPADDTPRLVYADWLDEHGEPDRAEFIRVQCELVRLDRVKAELLDDDTDWELCDTESSLSASWCSNCGDCTCPEGRRDDPSCPLHSPDSKHCCVSELAREADALRERERKLLNLGWQTWMPEFPRSFVVEAFDRGFVESVACTAADFERHAKELFAAHPITEVRLTDADPPLQLEHGPNAGKWFWALRNLPFRLRRWMPSRHGVFTDHFTTDAEALGALSAACVAYGRSLAKLSPLIPVQPGEAVG